MKNEMGIFAFQSVIIFRHLSIQQELFNNNDESKYIFPLYKTNQASLTFFLIQKYFNL